MGFRRDGRIAVVLVTSLMLVACEGAPTGPQAAAPTARSAAELELVEVIARPFVDLGGAFVRPVYPTDTIEIAMRTQGATPGTDLSVAMISLADGSTVGKHTLRLNAGNSAAPVMWFEPADNWPTGRYLFEVSLDDTLVGSQELEVFPAETDASTL